MNDTPPASRRTCMILFAAFVVSLLCFGVPAYLLGVVPHGSPVRPTDVTVLRPLFYGVGAASLFAAATFIKGRTRDLGDDPVGSREPRLSTPEKFQTSFVVALALSESCALYGLVLALVARSGLQDYLPFAVAAALIDAAFILPRARLYWDAWEKRNR